MKCVVTCLEGQRSESEDASTGQVTTAKRRDTVNKTDPVVRSRAGTLRTGREAPSLAEERHFLAKYQQRGQ